MANRRQNPEAMLERGRRLAEIRDRLGLTQYEMVDPLNAKARALGLPEVYRYYTVARMEGGVISFEDAAVYLALDPEQRSWDWFVFGKEKRAGKHPPPKPADPSLYIAVPPRRERKRKRSG